MKRFHFLLLFSVLVIGALFFIEQTLNVSYLIKMIIKWSLFLSLPLYYAKFVAKKSVNYLPNFRALHKKEILKVALLGTFTFIMVIAGYFIFRQFIDLENIALELAKIGVTPLNFIFIAFYITFLNSFLEEFFFRGYIFSSLADEGKTKCAFIISALMFAIYHIGIFLTWFSWWISLIALLGLFVGGLIFNWANYSSRNSGLNIRNSWVIHIAADMAIMIVGFMMFGFI